MCILFNVWALLPKRYGKFIFLDKQLISCLQKLRPIQNIRLRKGDESYKISYILHTVERKTIAPTFFSHMKIT